MDQVFINKAVELAAENVAYGGKPFGFVFVADANIIATGINESAQTGNLTAHAEIQAMRHATQAGKQIERRGDVCQRSSLFDVPGGDANGWFR